MKIFKAYLKQDGGCDYTIGCGKLVIDIKAESLEDAKIKLFSIIVEEYNHDEVRLANVELFEVSSITKVDIEGIYKKLLEDEKANIEIMKLEKERAEFERLKKKFGN